MADVNNLSENVPYTGTDLFKVGNDAQLVITHIGTSILTTTAMPLTLSNVLCVPEITKNIDYLSLSSLNSDHSLQEAALLLNKVNKEIPFEMSFRSCFIRTSKLTISTTTSLSVGALENMIEERKAKRWLICTLQRDSLLSS